MLFREQKLLPSSLLLDPRAPLCVTDEKLQIIVLGMGGERKHLLVPTMAITWTGSLS